MNRIENSRVDGTQVSAIPLVMDGRQTPVGNGKEVFLSAKDKPKSSSRLDVRLLVVGGGVVLVVLLLALSGISHRPLPAPRPSNGKQAIAKPSENGVDTAASITPIMETGRSAERDADPGLISPDEIVRTANEQLTSRRPRNLGSLPPFDNIQPWQAPPYQPASQASTSISGGTAQTEADNKNDRDALDKASLVFVRSNPDSAANPKSQAILPDLTWEIGLPPGARLRARLESAVSTAVKTPVVAVVEYNYERNGEMAIPAGAKAFGHLETADHSGYVGIRFDSLMLPDGSSLNLDAAATDLQLRPLRGRVEGKHTGKNFIVRSFAGVGEIAASLVGRGSLNQPLSEGDLLRERLSNNMGQVSDQEVASSAISEHLVVSVPADTEIYIVVQKQAKENPHSGRVEVPVQASTQPSIEELRQLLQLRRELSQPVTNP
jgi:hypothetical protein